MLVTIRFGPGSRAAARSSFRRRDGSATSGTEQPDPFPNPSSGSSSPFGTQEESSVQEISHEGILKEALTRIWEDARKAGFSAIGEMQISLYDVQDAFVLLGPIGGLPQCEKKVQMTEIWKPRMAARFPLFLKERTRRPCRSRTSWLPQFRAAADKTMTMTIALTFTNGLSLVPSVPMSLPPG